MPSSSRSRSSRTTAKSSRPGGRPTKDDAAHLTQDIQEAALARFLDHGYEGTSIDDIARDAHTTKASVYSRFANKASLFGSVIEWATGRSDWPEPEATTSDRDGSDNLEDALRSIADATRRRATHPSMVKLTRVSIAQAGQFPELAQNTLAASWSAKQSVVDLLQHHAATGAIVAEDPEILAEQFLGLVAGMPAFLAAFGVDRDDATAGGYGDVAIELFLRGLRPD